MATLRLISHLFLAMHGNINCQFACVPTHQGWMEHGSSSLVTFENSENDKKMTEKQQNSGTEKL